MNAGVDHEQLEALRFTRPRILLATSEAAPLLKTGGLADVCAALPKALIELGADAQLILPAYPAALAGIRSPRRVADLGQVLGSTPVQLWHGTMPDSEVPVWLVDCPPLFDRPGSPYQDEAGRDWGDNAYRYALFCHVVARLALGRVDGVGWRPQLVHCHDWHTGLVPLLLHHASAPRPRTVFTIHNIAFQGNFPFEDAHWLGLPPEALTFEGAEFHGRFSFLKAGIRYADLLSTVSPTHAQEILGHHGFGFEGLLQARRGDLVGIMNGIDHAQWDPASDPHLDHRYARPDCGGKAACKTQLQRELGLPVDAEAPLMVSVSRLTWQKMADLLADSLPQMMQRHPRLQLALIGRGDREVEHRLAALGGRYGQRVSIRIGFDEPTAHRLHAGGDLLLHGSRFEPCGLAQLYAMRYGTLPLVTRVGGLADSVRDAGQPAATGFVFDDHSGVGMAAAVERSLHAHESQPQHWRRMQHAAMNADFGWRESATRYLQLYARRPTQPMPAGASQVVPLRPATESAGRERGAAALRALA